MAIDNYKKARDSLTFRECISEEVETESEDEVETDESDISSEFK